MCTGCGKSLARFFFITFNLVLLLLGLALFAVGIWFRANEDAFKDIRYSYYKDEDEKLQQGFFILASAGAVMMLAAVLGFIGAFRVSKCMLGLFAVGLLVAMGLEIACAVQFIRYADELQDIELQVQKNFEIDFDAKVTDAEDSYWKDLKKLQKEAKCCGVDGPEDYGVYSGVAHLEDCQTADSPAENSTTVGTLTLYPCSCCEGEASPCTVHTSGCWKKLEEYKEDDLEAFIGVGLGLALVAGVAEIVGVFLMLFLCMYVDSTSGHK